jgi:predicted DNA-binding ribbon-helix-helix protein
MTRVGVKEPDLKSVAEFARTSAQTDLPALPAAGRLPVKNDLATIARTVDPELPLSIDDLEPEFRVVVRNGNRRGIRLERFFWAALKRFAESRNITLGKVVEEIAQVAPETGNLTSAIRVACARWLADENAELRKLASLRSVNAVLTACASPAFAMSSSRKILTFNPAFQQLVRRHLTTQQSDDGRRDIKLALDLEVADIVARLAVDGDRPVVTGFVVGAEDRRYRGQINIVRAPASESEVLLAFVLSS